MSELLHAGVGGNGVRMNYCMQGYWSVYELLHARVGVGGNGMCTNLCMQG